MKNMHILMSILFIIWEAVAGILLFLGVKYRRDLPEKGTRDQKIMYWGSYLFALIPTILLLLVHVQEPQQIVFQPTIIIVLVMLYYGILYQNYTNSNSTYYSIYLTSLFFGAIMFNMFSLGYHLL
jgi:predicted membrane protein